MTPRRPVWASATSWPRETHRGPARHQHRDKPLDTAVRARDDALRNSAVLPAATAERIRTTLAGEIIAPLVASIGTRPSAAKVNLAWVSSMIAVSHVDLPERAIVTYPKDLPTCFQPGVEPGEAVEALTGHILPNMPSIVLHAFLDDTLLPLDGDVAEVGLEQIVRRHRGRARVDDVPLTRSDLVT